MADSAGVQAVPGSLDQAEEENKDRFEVGVSQWDGSIPEKPFGRQSLRKAPATATALAKMADGSDRPWMEAQAENPSALTS